MILSGTWRQWPWSVRLGVLTLRAGRRREAALLLDYQQRNERSLREAFARGGADFRTALEEQLRVLADLFAESGPGESRLRGLRAVIDHHHLRRRDFSAMLDGCQQMVSRRSFSDWRQLDAALYQSAGVTAAMLALILGADPARQPSAAASFGKAVRLSHLLCKAGAALEEGRIVFPIADLEEFGVDDRSLAAREHTPELGHLTRRMGQRLRQFLSDAEPIIGEFPEQGTRRCVRALHSWQLELAQRIDSADFNLFRGDIEFTPWSSLRFFLPPTRKGKSAPQ